MIADVVVVGAGVQGCGVALRLAQAGRRVVVLERAIPGAEASSAAGGILSPGVEAVEPGPFYALCAASLARWEPFAREVERLSGAWVAFRREGTLEVAVDDAHAQVLAARAAKLEKHGLPVEVLDDAALRALEPGVSPAARGALLFRDEASLDPRLLGRALYVAAVRAGAAFVTGQVRRIRTAGGRAAGVDHEAGRIDAGAVVLAAGSWSLQVEGHGLPPGAVRPVRGQIAVLDTRPPLLGRVVFSGRGYVVPRPDGRILCGSTMEEVGFEKAVTAGGLRTVLDIALEIAPALARAPVVETWANFRPASPDGEPILGAGEVPGLFYATGHTRNGILLAPVTADAIAAAVLGGARPARRRAAGRLSAGRPGGAVARGGARADLRGRPAVPDSPELSRILDRLVDRVARGRLLLLVGAGASRWAGLPSWRETVRALADDLVPALRARVPHAHARFEPPAEDAHVPVEALVRIPEVHRFVCGEDRLVARLRALFDTSRVDPAALPLQRVLVRLAEFVPALYTTNFDDLLERTFAWARRPFQAVADAEDLHRWKLDEVDGRFVPRFPIYKLHGTLDRPETLVIGEADFHRRSNLAASPIDLRFCSDAVGRELLLVGYGFADPNVRWIWTKLRDLRVLPVAWFLEIGASSDLELAAFEMDRIVRVDLEADDAERPRELLDFLAALAARCERELGPGRAGAGAPSPP
jgi:glycine oxidase